MYEVEKKKLRKYLSEKWKEEDLTIEAFRELSSGWSRITYALTVTFPRKQKKQSIIVQVEKKNSLIIESNLKHDYQVFQALEHTSVPAPKAYFFEMDPSLLGGTFLVQSKLEGKSYDMFSQKDRSILKEHWVKGTNLPSNVLDGLIEIHNTPLRLVNFLSNPAKFGKVSTYEIDRCWKVAQQIGVDRDPFISFIFFWLRNNQPDHESVTLIHGDFHIRNLMIKDDQLSGILDWEVARISDPLFDLAYMCIPYLAGKFFSAGSPYACGLLPKDWLIEEYQKRTGKTIDIETFRFWRVLATVSLLLIIGTGVTAFKRKERTDIRSAWLRYLEPVLTEDILSVVKADKSKVIVC